MTMAVITNRVNHLVTLGHPVFALQVMAIAAILFLVAVHALQAIEIDMVLVVKSNGRAGFIRCSPDLCFRNGDFGVRDADYVGRVIIWRGQRTALRGQVANDTLGVMTPFPVTRHALTMVGAFQSRFPERLRFRRLIAMTLAAGRELAGRAVVMTN